MIEVHSRAHGEPLFRARIRTEPADFRVSEQLAFDFSDDGEHDWLRVEKTGANTAWVAGQLARFAGIPERDVGFAGLKDRHAITSQWFSVRRIGEPDWSAFAADGVRITEQQRHRRKLRRGSHAGNRFELLLRDVPDTLGDSPLDSRLAAIRSAGVPNYFGPQRFGHGGRNVELGRQVLAGKRLSRAKRSIAISAVRSELFNRVLSARIDAGHWNRLLDGECVNLAGSRSVFVAGEIDPELEARCASGDVHPTAALWGDGAPLAAGAAADFESAVHADSDLARGLERARIDAGSRPLRLPVPDLEWRRDSDQLQLSFSLPGGSFATSVLREIADCEAAAGYSAPS